MKRRLDVLLAERGLAPSRTAAQALVMAGKVRVDGCVATKAGFAVDTAADVAVDSPPRFVSRGGDKLEAAFSSFPGWTVQGLVCLDVGSSTGGFTDCLLQHGALRVMAVDVGTNQLAWKLRSDPRVWSRENFNARHMKIEDLPERPARAVTDVSFISLKLILPRRRDGVSGEAPVRGRARSRPGRRRLRPRRACGRRVRHLRVRRRDAWSRTAGRG